MKNTCKFSCCGVSLLLKRSYRGENCSTDTTVTHFHESLFGEVKNHPFVFVTNDIHLGLSKCRTVTHWK